MFQLERSFVPNCGSFRTYVRCMNVWANFSPQRDVGLKCTTEKKNPQKKVIWIPAKNEAWQKKRLIIRANNALEILLASLVGSGSVFRDQEFFHL